jgi:uncharacterized protein with HEPN domain
LDIKTQSAVERQLAIIGEVVNKMRTARNHIKQYKANKCVDFRNRIIHSYDNIDASIIWAILKNHLNILKQEIKTLL